MELVLDDQFSATPGSLPAAHWFPAMESQTDHGGEYGTEDDYDQPSEYGQEQLNPGEKVILVDIQREQVQKPFLGGFRHRKTGVEYHHASSQTWVPKKPKVRFIVPQS